MHQRPGVEAVPRHEAGDPRPWAGEGGARPRWTAASQGSPSGPGSAPWERSRPSPPPRGRALRRQGSCPTPPAPCHHVAAGAVRRDRGQLHGRGPLSSAAMPRSTTSDRPRPSKESPAWQEGSAGRVAGENARGARARAVSAAAAAAPSSPQASSLSTCCS